MAENKQKTYVATYPTRGRQTVLIRNCRSAKEARKKLHGHYHIGNHPDVDPLSHEITATFHKAADVVEDKGPEGDE